ncbi:MAG TPA: Crp/Fnr family transcriptional regulator [Acidisarcina sp.]|nr:Crp/Fnr family transcriptional regulator [Acidisarcina sp.]
MTPEAFDMMLSKPARRSTRRLGREEAALAGCAACPNRKPGWFCSLGNDVLADLDVVSNPITAATAQNVFSQGDDSDHVFVLCGGYVKLTASSSRGRNLIVRIAGPGAILGLHAAMSQRPYEVSAEALSEARLRSISREDFMGFLRRHKESQLRAVQCVCQEYRFALQDACRIALTESVAARLARLLIELAQQIGEWDDGEYHVPILLTHEEMASMTCTTRETITRTLGQLRKEGTLSIHDSILTLHDPEKLHSYF